MSINVSNPSGLKRVRKSISYAFPSSAMAEHLGMNEGCYYVDMLGLNEAGEFVSFILPDCEGFATCTDDDLRAYFDECEGELCANSLKYKPERYNR